MKKTWKTVLSFVLLVCLALSLAACGSKEPVDVKGTTWVLSGGADADGNKVTGEQIAALMGEITYEFGEDGNVTVLMDGESMGSAPYSQDGNKINFEASGVSATLEGNKMTMEQSGMSMEFTKK